jgi:hypothetical protein
LQGKRLLSKETSTCNSYLANRFKPTSFYTLGNPTLFVVNLGKQITVLLAFVLLTASWTVTFLPARAEGREITVPGDYQTISEAVKNANAGDIVFVKSGTYQEKQLTINKSLSLIGENVASTIINFDPPQLNMGETISWIDGKPTTIWIHDFSMKVEADNFKMQNLTIKTTGGLGTSITGNSTQLVGNVIGTSVVVVGSYLHIVENKFLDNVGVSGSYSTIVANSGTIYAVGSCWNISYNKEAYIDLIGSYSVIYGNSAPKGITVSGEENLIARNIIDQADIGLSINGSNNVACANRITNCRDKFFVSGYPPPTSGVGIRVSGNNTFYANYIADNTWGANINWFFENNSTSIFYHNNFVNNMHQVATDDLYDVYGNDSFDNGEEGNYWSDYMGTDADEDGVGDIPYVIDANRQDRYPLMAPFDIDSVTIELPDWANPSTAEPPQSNIPETKPNPTPLIIIAIAATTAALISVALFVHLKKSRRHRHNPD